MPLPKLCPCPSCSREGQHHPDCAVHLADNEHLDPPPCDCGVRDGECRDPENLMVEVHCAVDPSERPN